MRYLLVTLIATLALILEASSISVPTGKETPITPAKPTPRPVYTRRSRAPIPVVEYTFDNPEPAPLDPSYVPISIKYIQALAPNAIYYVPIRVRNYANYREQTKEEIQNTEQPVVIPREQDYSRTTKRPTPIYDYNTNNGVKYVSKPVYYQPKGTPIDRIPTKGGYPKKATSRTINNKYYYYVNNQN